MKISKILAIWAAIFAAGTLASFAGTLANAAGTPENSDKNLPLNEQAVRDFETMKKSLENDENPDAQIDLAVFYAWPLHDEADQNRAREILEKWAARGNARAMFVLWEITNRDDENLLKKSAELGYVPAMREFGLRQEKSFPQDYKFWLLKAAEAGDREAQTMVARAFENGENAFPQDEIQANFWWKKAIESGDKNAQFELGKNFANGIGCEKNLDEAQKWLKLAICNESWEALDFWKTHFAGTPLPRISLENWPIPLFKLGEKLPENYEEMLRSRGNNFFRQNPYICWVENAEFLGEKWRFILIQDKFGVLRGIHFMQLHGNENLPAEFEKYQQFSAKFLQDFGEFEQRSRKVVGWRDSFPQSKNSWGKSLRFFDGQTAAHVELNSRYLGISFDLKPENWEWEFKLFEFPNSLRWNAKDEEIRARGNAFLSAGTDLDALTDFCVEHFGRQNDAEKYCDFEAKIAEKLLDFAGTAEEMAQIYAIVAAKCPSDSELDELEKTYKIADEKAAGTDFDLPENRAILRERESARVRYFYARGIRRFFDLNVYLPKFVDLLARDCGNDLEQMNAIYEKSCLEKIDFETLADKQQFLRFLGNRK